MMHGTLVVDFLTTGLWALVIGAGIHRLSHFWAPAADSLQSYGPGNHGPLPTVELQLIFTEMGPHFSDWLRAGCELVYPSPKFQIRFIDQSGGAGSPEARQEVEEWRQEGVSIT